MTELQGVACEIPLANKMENIIFVAGFVDLSFRTDIFKMYSIWCLEIFEDLCWKNMTI